MSLSKAQRDRLFTIATERKITNEEVKNILINNYDIDSTKLIKKSDYDDIVLAVEEFAANKQYALPEHAKESIGNPHGPSADEGKDDDLPL